MEEAITWFVTRYPSKDSNEGRVLWDKEYPTKEECEMECKRLGALDPEGDYEPSDLPELEQVFERDVQPVLESLTQTKH
jgi:hypothetical protein